jgi:hypothetical protein
LLIEFSSQALNHEIIKKNCPIQKANQLESQMQAALESGFEDSSRVVVGASALLRGHARMALENPTTLYYYY